MKNICLISKLPDIPTCCLSFNSIYM